MDPYKPPKQRLLISRNIFGNYGPPIPIFSDLEINSQENWDIPETLCFNYITDNIINTHTNKKLHQLIDMSNEGQGWITCGCSVGENGLVNCFDNPNCPCFEVNKTLEALQKTDEQRPMRTQFKTFNHLNVRGLDEYFDTFAFCCSEKCACQGACSNNVMYMTDKNAHRFEVYRYDEKGFGVRAMSYIPYGTPVIEFKGELVEYKTCLERGSNDYSFQIKDKKLTKLENASAKILKSIPGYDQNYAKLVKETLCLPWYLDPKTNGNEARFITHGCLPNLSLIIAFKGGFSPHQMHCLMISSEDIYPGTQLTFDYGESYASQHLSGNCLCETLTCQRNEEFKVIGLATHYSFIREHYFYCSFEIFTKNVNHIYTTHIEIC
ncbi:unnamed protein product [Caenorhabditis bovis]|uniref:SET domain-containing protein n=1 Tax=Caenorhabditis bovis TaxID=2654633 RepID=A0A8S1FA08_9PELO|nr:unnamed protein product [Caenorhabditis bovis]